MTTPLETAIGKIFETDFETPYHRIVAIIVLMDEHYNARLNDLAEKLDRRTTELQRLQRLVGEEA